MSAERHAGRVHYAWIVAAVTFVVMLVTAGIRATPSLLFVPLETEFGWSRTALSAAIAINIALFGLVGPFAASAMNRWGLRRVMLIALALVAGAVALSVGMWRTWHMTLLWGVMVGLGTGVTSMVLAAVVATRWFDTKRGMVLGALSAANATGQLIFLPVLASAVDARGWRPAVLVVAGAAAVVFALVAVFMRDRPEDLGLRRYGQADNAGPALAPLAPLAALRLAARSRAFWLLAGTFFICGASTNGLIGTHLIAACHDYGIHAVDSARLLAVMGLFDILGTTASGWLTDRYSSRHLLFAYYTLRGLALLALPATLAGGGLAIGLFAVFYGLDWIATVPPTVRLTSDAFGRENTGVIYGWIGASHQLGASLAAFTSGVVRTWLGDYTVAFWGAGVLCVMAGLAFLASDRHTFTRTDAVPAGVPAP